MSWSERPAEVSRWAEAFSRFKPSEKAWVRRAAKIGYGACVVIGGIAIACIPWVFLFWLLANTNRVLGGILAGCVIVAILSLATSGWLKAKAGGYVNV
jgi:hypothetical protein